MYIRHQSDALDALAGILDLPDRRQQIVQSTIKIMLCLDAEPRMFLVDCQALLLEGGLEALRRIKAFDPSIRVVVVTGVDDPALPRQALALGASAVLQKPVEQEALLAALGEVSPSGSPVSDAQKTVATAPPTGPGLAGRVLVVDDEAEIRAVLEEYLLPKGYRVRSVADGAAALREVIDEAPDVILLDVDMPRLGGIEALTAIRGITRKVRVIMISGKASLETAKLALAYGAFDYIAKPFDLDHLGEVVAAAFLQDD